MTSVYVLCLLLMLPVAERYLRWEAKKGGAVGPLGREAGLKK
jgi:hypothetical protein